MAAILAGLRGLVAHQPVGRIDLVFEIAERFALQGLDLCPDDTVHFVQLTSPPVADSTYDAKNRGDSGHQMHVLRFRFGKTQGRLAQGPRLAGNLLVFL